MCGLTVEWEAGASGRTEIRGRTVGAGRGGQASEVRPAITLGTQGVVERVPSEGRGTCDSGSRAWAGSTCRRICEG